MTAGLNVTVLICTYNRAALLGETLDSLAAQRTSRNWEVVVVDNNSGDDTAEVVKSRIAGYAVSLRYLFEPRQGKSNALNTGLAVTHGDIVAFTDDDVRVDAGWIDAVCDALDAHPELDYTGGPVRPRWGGTPPPWFDRERSDLWGTLALLDYGPEPFIFEERRKVPLGVNMAVRRGLFARIGGFNPDLGRKGKSLIGQEQAEFFARARAAGVRGIYAPAMTIDHYVPADRLNKQYFRRWWFWKGVSRARLDHLHHLTELGLDLRHVPYVARVPRFVWGMLPHSAWGWMHAMVTRAPRRAALEEMRICYTVGYIRARLSRQASPLGTAPAVPTSRQLPSVSG